MLAKLNTSALQQAEFARMVWVATPEPGVTLEMLMRPDYWSHVAKQLRPWHRIEVRDAGFEWCAELVVRDCGQNWAKVELVSFQEFGAKAQAAAVKAPETLDFEVVRRGRAGWSVKRVSDHAVMVEDLPTRDDANAWLQRHLGQIAA